MLGKLAEKRRSRSYFFLLLGMGVCGVKMFNFGALGKTLKKFFLCASSLTPSHFPDTSSNVLLLLLESLGWKIFTSLVIMFFLLQYFWWPFFLNPCLRQLRQHSFPSPFFCVHFHSVDLWTEYRVLFFEKKSKV